MTAHAPRTVAIAALAPDPQLLGEPGRNGGRHRWWVSVLYGARWKRRGGYLTAEVPPAEREASQDVARFTLSLVPGVRYCIGVGDARYELTLPPGEYTAIEVHPLGMLRALVRLSDGTTIDTDPVYPDMPDTDTVPF